MTISNGLAVVVCSEQQDVPVGTFAASLPVMILGVYKAFI